MERTDWRENKTAGWVMNRANKSWLLDDITQDGLDGSRVGLWIVESLATSGLYCMIF